MISVFREVQESSLIFQAVLIFFFFPCKDGTEDQLIPCWAFRWTLNSSVTYTNMSPLDIKSSFYLCVERNDLQFGLATKIVLHRMMLMKN